MNVTIAENEFRTEETRWVCCADGSFWETARFLSVDYLYVPTRDIEASVRYYTDQLRGELVWTIHAFNAWVAAVRLSPTGPLVLLADHRHGDTSILIYDIEGLESTVAALRVQG